MTITCRPYAGEDDYARMRALVRAIYPRTESRLYCTVGDLDWWRFTADPGDRLEPAQLWLEDGALVAFTWPGRDQVVEAPDGNLAAFSIVWFDEVNRIGVFEPVGTHSAHRRLGLGAAVMCQGLRRLQRLGAHTAYVNAWGHTPAANALYASAGFQLVDLNWMWKTAL